jgi:hypothetical protein
MPTGARMSTNKYILKRRDIRYFYKGRERTRIKKSYRNSQIDMRIYCNYVELIKIQSLYKWNNVIIRYISGTSYSTMLFTDVSSRNINISFAQIVMFMIKYLSEYRCVIYRNTVINSNVSRNILFRYEPIKWEML